ncbi:hypothetical protein GCM10027589_33850 [Actinocorallia lasiicapitis]
MTGTVSPLLDSLVDDAGLFPPERLPMGQALARHRSDRAAGHPLLTHRFLCPASRWPELLAALLPDDHLTVGLLLDGPLPPDDPRVTVDLAEHALPAGDQQARLAEALPHLKALPFPVFVEPRRGEPAWLDTLPTLAAHGLGAKLRCGGVDPALFPAPAEVASFLTACADLALPFKATAGLHPALPYTDPATGFHHYGHLNLLLATATALTTRDGDLLTALTRPDPHLPLAALPPATITSTRRLFTGFGSCSTTDPLTDAITLNLATP